MSSWMLKAAVQGVVSRLPKSRQLNGLLQQRTRSLVLTDERFSGKWVQACRHIANAGSTTPPRCVVELGTGWYPTVPIGLALQGVQRVITIDLEPLFDRQRTLEVLRRYQDFAASGRIELSSTAGRLLDEALKDSHGRTAVELLRSMGVESQQIDARDTGLPEGSVDLFVSNNTLEHIGGPMLEEIFCEYARIAAPDATMSHFIDMADHYAGFDRSISVFNFLQFGPQTWRLFNNRLQYQNRLRLSQYRKIHEDAGWTVTQQDPHREPLEVLRSVALSSGFRHFGEDDLRVSSAWMCSQQSSHGS